MEPRKPDHRAAEAKFKLANIWQAKGRLENAIASYEEAIRLRPDYVPAHLELGKLRLQQGQIDEAVAVYRRAAELNPGEATFSQRLAALLDQQAIQTEGLHDAAQESVLDRQGANGSRGHILLYTDRPGISGAEQCNHLLMLRLVTEGYRVTCAQAKASHYLIDERRQAGIEQVWLADDDLYDTTRTPKALTDTAEAEQILATTQPDLVLFSDGSPFSNLAAKQVTARLGIPQIVVVHCVTLDWSRQFAPYASALADAYQQAQAVIAVSQENLTLLHEQFGLPTDKGQVIHNGRPANYFSVPDPATRERLRQQLNIPPEGVVCFTAARMEMVKGYQYQIAAIKQLRQRAVWQQLYFVWAGTGSLESQLRAVAEELDAADKVIFLGERADIPDLLEAADIFVLPSQFEGMPLSVMEAMAKGLPVIATAISGTPEELGETGKLLPDPNVEPQTAIDELVETVEAWVANPQLRQSVGQACGARAAEMFTADQMLEKYLGLIEGTLDA